MPTEQTTEQNHMPNEVFEWVEHLTFESLSIAQRETVLLYFSRNEYEELHQAALQAKQSLKRIRNNKALLMEAFDKQYSSHSNSISWKPAYVWKAAVLLLLMTIGGLQLRVLNNKTKVASVEKIILDTVVVVKDRVAPALNVHDTVWMAMTHAKKPNHNTEVLRQTPIVTNDSIKHFPSGVHVLTINEMDATPNRQRGSSQKEDTLMKQFQFAMM